MGIQQTRTKDGNAKQKYEDELQRLGTCSTEGCLMVTAQNAGQRQRQKTCGWFYHVSVCFVHIYIYTLLKSSDPWKNPTIRLIIANLPATALGLPRGLPRVMWNTTRVKDPITKIRSDLVSSKECWNERQIYRNIRPFAMGPECVVYGFSILGYFFELKILESLSPAEAAQGRAMKKL